MAKMSADSVNGRHRGVSLIAEEEVQPRPEGVEIPIWEKIKRLAPAMEFIGQYVALTSTASGGVGHCPFHKDEHQSFGVHEDGNFWHCFAGCGSGSVIDFYMKWHDVEFGDAVHDLSKLVLYNF